MNTLIDPKVFKKAMDKVCEQFKEWIHQDDPTITDYWEKDGLAGFTVSYTDEQIERMSKRPRRGYRIPFN